MLLSFKGAPLVKIQSQNIIDSFKSGNVYMNSLSFYRELEEENSEIGDSYEGRVHISQGKLIIPELSQSIELNDDLIRTAAEDAFVFCMFSIPENLTSFTFSDYQKTALSNFGDSALIITSKEEFIKRLSDRLFTEGYSVSYGYVSYFKPTEDSASTFVDLLRGGIVSVALHKREKYSYQQEFRIIAQKPNSHDDHICVNIGDISDISYQITIKQLLNSSFSAHE